MTRTRNQVRDDLIKTLIRDHGYTRRQAWVFVKERGYSVPAFVTLVDMAGRTFAKNVARLRWRHDS